MSSRRIEKRRATLYEKMKKALLLLLIQRKSIPGAKGFELKKHIGSKYLYVLKLLDKELESFGLKINTVLPEGKEDYDHAHFYIVSREPILGMNLKGEFNIEELGCLSACILFLLANSNRVNLSQMEEFLSTKISKVKAKRYIEKFRRKGYLEVDQEGIIRLGWRSYAEINFENLSKILAIYKI